MNRLTDKVCVITGAAGDIGRDAARLFINEGAKVLLVDRDPKKLDQLVSELATPNAIGIAADVSNEKDVSDFMAAADKRFGGLDVVLANAGIAGPAGKTLEHCTVEEFDHVMSVNVRGVWLAIKHSTPFLRARGGGSIVVTSSIAGLVGAGKAGPYVTSKHALMGLSKTAAVELARDKIRVNTVNPGPVESSMMREIEHGFSPDNADNAKQGILSTIPFGRYVHTDEVAKMMLFLASDDSSFCTGSAYVVDGGLVAI
ncbi:MAG: SDR family NAD(P)-dependent oxidoreductase [Sheuella sp.]|nr:SDR family NAD(P)-dependent oxidoreductase [Sheuella sp.]